MHLRRTDRSADTDAAQTNADDPNGRSMDRRRFFAIGGLIGAGVVGLRLLIQKNASRKDLTAKDRKELEDLVEKYLPEFSSKKFGDRLPSSDEQERLRGSISKDALEFRDFFLTTFDELLSSEFPQVTTPEVREGLRTFLWKALEKRFVYYVEGKPRGTEHAVRFLGALHRELGGANAIPHPQYLYYDLKAQMRIDIQRCLQTASKSR